MGFMIFMDARNRLMKVEVDTTKSTRRNSMNEWVGGLMRHILWREREEKNQIGKYMSV